MPNKRNKKSCTILYRLIILGIIVIAANLRTPLTSVGPLVSLIRDDVHISNTLAGLITTVLACLCFIIAFSTKIRTKVWG